MRIVRYIASNDIVTISYSMQSNVWLSWAVLRPDQFSSRLMMKVWVLEMKQVWMEGEMKERESGTRTSNRAAASPLSYHRNTSYSLCCPRISRFPFCVLLALSQGWAGIPVPVHSQEWKPLIPFPESWEWIFIGPRSDHSLPMSVTH